MSLDRIVVGVDGSEGSRNALRWAAELARDTETEAVVVHGWSQPEVEGEGEAIVEDAARYLAQYQIPVRVVIEMADPGELLSDVAVREGADLIVIGSRGKNLLAQLVLGSVGEHLTHHAERPVTIVRGTWPAIQAQRDTYLPKAESASRRVIAE